MYMLHQLLCCQQAALWPSSLLQLSSCCALLQDILIGSAKLTGPHSIKYNLPGRVDVGGEVTAKDIMLATGSVPFVPPGIPIDGKTVSDMAYHILPYLPYLTV